MRPLENKNMSPALGNCVNKPISENGMDNSSFLVIKKCQGEIYSPTSSTPDISSRAQSNKISSRNKLSYKMKSPTSSPADRSSRRRLESKNISPLAQMSPTSPGGSDLIKSGNLVLICPQRQNSNTHISEKMASTRSPVAVKIHRKPYESFAIITKSRRLHPTSPPLYVSLKHTQAHLSPLNPSRFNVVIDSLDGQYFTLEASSPASAHEWVLAFSTNPNIIQSPSDVSSPHHPSHPSLHSATDKPTLSSHSCEESCKENMPALPSPAVCFGYENAFSLQTVSPRIPRSPLMPVLTESSEEEDEKEVGAGATTGSSHGGEDGVF